MATIVIVGNLGKDHDAPRYTPDGTYVVSLNIAERVSKDKTVWYRCSWFGKTAEKTSQYLTKGKTVQVVGNHATEDNGEPRIWKDKDGNAHAENAVRVSELKLIGGSKGDAEPTDDLPW